MPFSTLLTTPSVLVEAVERVRQDLDEPSMDAKFSDNYIVRMNLMPAFTECVSLLNLQADNPCIFRATLNVTAGTSSYQLPPCVAQVLRLAKLDERGVVTDEMLPRSQFNWCGPGWALEGNTIVFRPTPQKTDADWALWYVPGGDIQPHLSSSGSVNVADEAGVFRLAATLSGTDLGTIDKREQAYVGQVLRILSGTTVIERIIDRHYLEGGLWKVRARVPFTLSAATYTYEIVPFVANHFWVMVAKKAAIELGASRGISQAAMRNLYLSYENAKKCVLDTFSNMQARTGKHFIQDTTDRPSHSPAWYNQLRPGSPSSTT